MAGHSQFKNIMYRKGAQDAKRAKAFTKLIRELTVAARTGLPDPEFNARLRTAITAAKAANMAKDTMERAIKRGSGEDGGAQSEEVRYEGYGPGGVALIVEALTDNRNRTASELRPAFSKHGGAFGETVNFQFEGKIDEWLGDGHGDSWSTMPREELSYENAPLIAESELKTFMNFVGEERQHEAYNDFRDDWKTLLTTVKTKSKDGKGARSTLHNIASISGISA